MLKNILKLLALVFVVILGIVLFNTFTFRSNQTHYEAQAAPATPDSALAHFRQSIGFQTISYGDPALWDSLPFLGFHRFLAATYPLMHQRLRLEIVEEYTLLYTWPGADTTLDPVVIMAHQDVVPIEEVTRDRWTVNPFAGEVKEGYIWGRGTTDDKINLVSICEAAEKLLAADFVPQRTIYFLFGHDEEIGGKGAKAVATRMQQAGIEAAMVLDEGGIITKDKVPGVTRPVALLGTAEKGYLSLVLSVELAGGHSSMPEKETAIDLLSRALVKLRSNEMPAKISEPLQGLINSLGPEMPFVQKMAFANPWLFKKLIFATYEKSGAGNAMVRTTLVPTIIHTGIKDNVVPSLAEATVNLRLLPGDSADAVVATLHKVIGDDRVKIRRHDGAFAEASPITPVRSFGYEKIDKIIKQSYPNMLSSPFIMIGATDSRHFTEVSKNIIKFSPMIDPIGFHGIDERVSLESFQTALWFFEQLIRDL